MNINHTFGTFIKDKRLAKQISLRKFAELLDISPVYLCNIEKDRNRPERRYYFQYGKVAYVK